MAPTTRSQVRLTRAYDLLGLAPKDGAKAKEAHDRLIWSLNFRHQPGGIPPSDPQVLRLNEALEVVQQHNSRPLSAKKIRANKKVRRQFKKKWDEENEERRKFRDGDLVHVVNGTFREVLTREEAEERAQGKPLESIGVVPYDEPPDISCA